MCYLRLADALTTSRLAKKQLACLPASSHWRLAASGRTEPDVSAAILLPPFESAWIDFRR